MSASSEAVRIVLAYHERTKHHVHRYANAPGYMDWDTQPDPFRTYDGAARVELPLAADGLAASYEELYANGAVPPRTLDLEALGAFFELALGLTAWKELGSARWALRADPSSGNLHPTEGYLVTRTVPSAGRGPAPIEAGVHHYASRDHALERRCRFTPTGERALEAVVPAGAFLVGVTSIHWRESWKYGERAYRYCQHDVGHVIGTVRYAAAALGWTARVVAGFGDEDLERLLGLDRPGDFDRVDEEDHEHPDLALLVGPPSVVDDGRAVAIAAAADELVSLSTSGVWSGRANELSSGHREWAAIDAVAAAARKPRTREEPVRHASPEAGTDRASVETETETETGAHAATIIRQRRSAVALDGTTSMPLAAFAGLLERLLPRARAPFDVLPWRPRLHLGLFVHRVDGLAPGLYVLERTPEVHMPLVAMLGEKPLWARPSGVPEGLRLYCLGELDVRRAAAGVSCGQEIAADGAFSLGMFAEFGESIERAPWEYRRLHWEAGLIGQALYLEAEARGLRGTGIGCFFDDAMHQVLGLEGTSLQSLYHFTVGGAVEDERLITLPPYAHLER